jgi:hypothetical protein
MPLLLVLEELVFAPRSVSLKLVSTPPVYLSFSPHGRTQLPHRVELMLRLESM